MSAHEHNNSFYNDTPWFIHECTLDLDEKGRRIALFLLHLLIFILGLFVNIIVLWVNWRRRHSANGVLFCIINMSLSDIMMVVTLPFFMMEVTIDDVWLWGKFLCIVTNLVYVMNLYSSSFFLALMTLERYLSLTKPAFPALFPVVGRRRWWLCGGVWLLSLFLALLENVHVDLLEWDEPGCYMLPEHSYFEWYTSIGLLNFIFQFVGPSAVIITCNVLIARTLHSASEVQDKRDIWLVHVYSFAFVLCWFPYHLFALLVIIDSLVFEIIYSCNFAYLLYFLYDIMEILSLSHCVINPILYNFLSKSFRNNLINTVVTYINKEGNASQLGARTQPNGERGGIEAGNQRKISNASTSQSDVGS